MDYEVGAVSIQIKSVGGVEAPGTIAGYGSVFGNVDSYNDVVEPGAFADSLKSGDDIPMLWQHDLDVVIGHWKAQEDGHGLACQGQIAIDGDEPPLPAAQTAYASVKRKLVKGLSIGYQIRDSSYDQKTEIRHLKKLDLMEISVVTFPANTSARIQSVKSAIAARMSESQIRRKFRKGEIPTEDEIVQLLKDYGCGSDHAAAIASKGVPSLHTSSFSMKSAADIVRQILTGVA